MNKTKSHTTQIQEYYLTASDLARALCASGNWSDNLNSVRPMVYRETPEDIPVELIAILPGGERVSLGEHTIIRTPEKFLDDE